MRKQLGQVRECVDFLRQETPIQPQVGIVLGTGLGGLAERIQADTVIVSIGQKPAISGSEIEKELQTGPGDRIIINDKYSTTKEGIFAAGDIVTGPSTVVESMASGKKAADKIKKFLTGKSAPAEKHRIDKRGIGDYIEISEKIPKQKVC